MEINKMLACDTTTAVKRNLTLIKGPYSRFSATTFSWSDKCDPQSGRAEISFNRQQAGTLLCCQNRGWTPSLLFGAILFAKTGVRDRVWNALEARENENSQQTDNIN